MATLMCHQCHGAPVQTFVETSTYFENRITSYVYRLTTEALLTLLLKTVPVRAAVDFQCDGIEATVNIRRSYVPSLQSPDSQSRSLTGSELARNFNEAQANPLNLSGYYYMSSLIS